MAYNPNEFSPMGQLMLGIGGGLSGIMQGYVNSKIEEDKLKRQALTNKQILRVQFPDMPKNDLDAYSNVPTQQLSGVISGLRSQRLGQVLGGGQQETPQGQLAGPQAELGMPQLPQVDLTQQGGMAQVDPQQAAEQQAQQMMPMQEEPPLGQEVLNLSSNK